MSRGFFGNSGGSKKTGGKRGNKLTKLLGSKDSLNRAKTTQSLASPRQKSYKEMLDDSIDKKMFSAKQKNSSTGLLGTKPQEEKEMSKGMKMAMQVVMEKRLKKRRREKKVEIHPKSYGMGEHGGRLDSSGKIMNNAGQILLRIDPETGIITDGFGIKVGKYDPKSAVCDTKIEKLIQKYSKQKSVFNPFAPKT